MDDPSSYFYCKFTHDLVDEIDKFERELQTVPNLEAIVDHLMAMENVELTVFTARIIHFVLYLNTDLDNCRWLKTNKDLNLGRYVHGQTLCQTTYFKLVEIMRLDSYVQETIMCTPYFFCRDLISMTLYHNNTKDAISQLSGTEKLILSMFKCLRRGPIKDIVEDPLTRQFNKAMIVFAEDYTPFELRIRGIEDEQKKLNIYNGYRVKSIFKILVEVIKYRYKPDHYRHFPLYRLKPIYGHQQTQIERPLFKKFFEVVMYKCMNMCNFSIESWLSWYEVELVEEETNLQATIGHLCFELCSFIDNGTVNESYLTDFLPILRNISIEQIDFTQVDTANIDIMIDCIKKSPKFHLCVWIKKFAENPNTFHHPEAIETYFDTISNIGFNSMKNIMDNCMNYYRDGGIIIERMGATLFHIIKCLDMEDKMRMLKHIIRNYADNDFYVTSDFEGILKEVTENELREDIDQKLVMSKVIWLVMQQPKKMLHSFISQYIYGICGLPVKDIQSRKASFHKVMTDIFLNIHPRYINEEYAQLLDSKTIMSDDQKKCLRQMIFEFTQILHLVEPKIFLIDILTPHLIPSSNYKHTLFLMSLTKFFITECQLIAQPDIDIWDTLIIQLAKIMEDARWTRENYSSIRVDICELIIMAIQPLLDYAAYIVQPDQMNIIKQAISGMHLITRSHFLRLWPSESITIDGMDEQFIMTVQSQSHISYSNLNSSSTQKSQEEFIFSIATYMPRFTLHEIKSVVANYLNSTNAQNIVEASFFLFDCFLNAMLRIIVYLNTVKIESRTEECANENVYNTIVNFLDAVNTSKMCCIYTDNVDPTTSFNTITKMVVVVKQLENNSQGPLLVIIRRLVQTLIPISNEETTMKILKVLASVKSQNAQKLLGDSMESLAQNLKASSQG